MVSVGASEPGRAAGAQPAAASDRPMSAAAARRTGMRSARLRWDGKDLEFALGTAEEALAAEKPPFDVVVLRRRMLHLAQLLPLSLVPVQQCHLLECEHGCPPTKVYA
jgi:hypothetical protein